MLGVRHECLLDPSFTAGVTKIPFSNSKQSVLSKKKYCSSPVKKKISPHILILNNHNHDYHHDHHHDHHDHHDHQKQKQIRFAYYLLILVNFNIIYSRYSR